MKRAFLITLFCCSCLNLSAQKYTFDTQHFTHDIGFFVGPYSLQTDYGQREDIRSEIASAGLSLSLVHYLTFFKKSARWNARYNFLDDIAIKTEINYMTTTKLQHYGAYASEISDAGLRYRSMNGTASIFNIGVSAEYYLKDLRTFSAHYSSFRWNPYVNIGIMYSSFQNEIISNLGDWTQDLTLLPEVYRPSNTRTESKGSTGSVIVGTGVRVKISEQMDISSMIRGQYFLNDNVDGLKKSVSGSRYYEWAVSIQLGVIWHLNFSEPLRIF